MEAQATVPVVSTEASASGVLPNASAAFTTMVLWDLIEVGNGQADLFLYDFTVAGTASRLSPTCEPTFRLRVRLR